MRSRQICQGCGAFKYNAAMRVREIAGHVLSFCYPGICANCGGAGDGQVPLCEPCRIDLHNLEIQPSCPLCAMPLPEPDAPCAHCLGDGVRPFQSISRLGTFADPLRHLVHQMKYHGKWGLAEFLADRLLEQPAVGAMLSQIDRIIAVPLHPFRQIARGYNQADVLARRIARRRKIRLIAPLARLRSTPTQTSLSHARRVENLRGAFGLRDPQSVFEKHVLVVDDVLTTAATLQSVGRTIKTGKPAGLHALVVAIADPKHHGFEAI
jgi:ComF family protein